MEDRSNDAPKLSMNVHRRTTQLNIWIVIGVLLFFALAGFYVIRLLKDPPDSHEEMKQGGRLKERIAWAASVC
jgi:hypothetical protein